MDQVRGLVHIARCSNTSEMVFAVGPEFIHEYWRNLDGCARAVVGWRGHVSIDENDMVTLRLLEVLISGSSVGEAVELVDGEFGLGGRLVFHPVEAYGFRLLT